VGRRARLVALLLLSSAAIAAAPGASAPLRVGSTFYLVEADPRLCPSPACGGYWVRLVNRSRTRCSDGIERERCYVARAVDEERHPLGSAVTHGAIARAEIEPWRFEGLGELGMLVVARIFKPVGSAKPTGRYFRLVDIGIRCVRAPCFTIRAPLLNTSKHTMLSGLAATGTVAESLVARVERALARKEALLVQGRVQGTADGGRDLLCSRFFFRSES
jgi:hypothetical protein